jgi:hypothetical protein
MSERENTPIEAKYGVSESGDTERLHRQRRMFCVINGEVIIAQPDCPHSHAKWLEELGIPTNEIDAIMSTSLRGAVDQNGNLRFYTGWDFSVDEKLEQELLRILPVLEEKLSLKPDTKIFGGTIKGEPGTVWEPRKYFGTLEEVKKQSEH